MFTERYSLYGTIKRPLVISEAIAVGTVSFTQQPNQCYIPQAFVLKFFYVDQGLSLIHI